MFIKAQKKQSKLKILLEGPSGSGKTYSSLMLASSMGGRIAVIDTEKSSSALYSNKFDFDICEITPPFTPEKYIEAIHGAEDAGYEVLIIDSISHEWNGDGGCLAIQSSLGGRFQDWAKVTPRHNRFINAIVESKIHIIATARTKSDYVLNQNGSRMKVEKIGLKSEQRDGLDFEFTTVLRLNANNFYEATKDRTGLFIGKEGIISEKSGEEIIEWLNDGVSESDLIESYKKSLSGSKTILDLKREWDMIPASYKKNLDAFKNEAKKSIEGSK